MGQTRTSQVRVRETQALLSSRCSWAMSSRSRMVGLLNHTTLEEEASLVIDPCKHVHMFFMRFAIDVVFLNNSNRVLKIQSLKPWRLSSFVWSARRVMELPEGRCARIGLQPGHHLEFSDA
jgi:uncharacterized membrane protein (UPF0127 family)